MKRRSIALGLPLLALCSASAVRAGDWLPAPMLPEVLLRDQRDQPVRLRELIRGRLVVVNFVFGSCVTVCPPQTALLREAARQIEAHPVLRDVLFVSLTVDPLSDGPLQLRQYAARFDLPVGPPVRWVLLTGSIDNVQKTLAPFAATTSSPADHPALLWLGHESRGRWTRTSALNPPHMLIRRLEALIS